MLDIWFETFAAALEFGLYNIRGYPVRIWEGEIVFWWSHVRHQNGADMHLEQFWTVLQ